MSTEIAVADWALAITSNRLALLEEGRLTLAIPIADLQRIELDIDRNRSGTLIIVPDESIDRPRALTFGRDGFEPVGIVLVALGRRLAEAYARP